MSLCTSCISRLDRKSVPSMSNIASLLFFILTIFLLIYYGLYIWTYYSTDIIISNFNMKYILAWILGVPAGVLTIIWLASNLIK